MRTLRIATFALVLAALAGSGVLAAPSKSPAKRPSTAAAVPQQQTKGTNDANIPDLSQPIEIESIPARTTDIPGSATQPTAAAAAAGLKIDWLSINGGGETQLMAGNIKMGVSVAQSVAGEVSAGNIKMGIGFWYGASGSGGACDCSFAGDIDASTAIDATDLQFLIDIVFFGGSDVQDPTCPSSRSDLDCSGFPDATDIQYIIDYIFFGGIEPCDGCQSAAQASR